MIATLILYSVVALICVLVGLPLAMRKVRPNPWYGFRTKKTRENETLWYEVNAATGKILVTGGIVAILALVFLYFQDVPAEKRADRFSSAALVVCWLDLMLVLILSQIRYLSLKKKYRS